MKKTLLVIALVLVNLSSMADSASEARKLLDKTVAAINTKSGAQASFVLSGGRIGRVEGTIAIKGNKFSAKTANTVVWYDGTTQWTYIKSTDEVNISTPTMEQQAYMNPLTFVNLYKTGYKLSVANSGDRQEVHLVADNRNASIQEMYVVITPSTYLPTQVRMLRSDGWISINISNFRATPQNDNKFVFNSNDFPTAEVVDLR